jgi:hypothetical protein
MRNYRVARTKMKLTFSLAVLALMAVFCRAEDVPSIKLTDLKLFPDTEKGHFGMPLDGSSFPRRNGGNC